MTSKHIADRVSRLESHLLDQELTGTFDGLVDQLELPAYSEELKIILKMYLFSNYIGANATAAKRYRKLEKFLNNLGLKGLNFTWLNLDNTALMYKAMDVVNFLVFLKNGTYLTLLERVLGIAPVITNEGLYNNTQLHQIQVDYMYRETIWRAIAEFLTTIMPMINIDQVKNRIFKLTGMLPRLTTEMKLSEKIQQESNPTRCAICLKQPFNPYIIGCRHVFCYYCLQAKYQVDPSMGYVCMHCKYSTTDPSTVQRFKSLRNL